MPYLLVSQSSAAMYVVLLSVTISSTAPHLHRISSKIKVLIVQPVSVQSARHSGQAVSEQRACMIYLKPLVGSMNMVSM